MHEGFQLFVLRKSTNVFSEKCPMFFFFVSFFPI